MVLILAGKSGSGKDAIQNFLKEESGFQPIVSTTTRPIREGEEEGVAYHFVSKEEFLKGIEGDKFLEYRSYDTLVDGKPDTWYYGSEKLNLDPNQDYVVVLDIQGAKDFVNYYGKDSCYTVEIQVDEAVREARASQRGSFDKTEWDRRAADDAIKFSPERTSEVCNVRVMNNGELKDTSLKVLDLYLDHKETVSRLVPECMAKAASETEKSVEMELISTEYEEHPYILCKQGNNEIALTAADVAALVQKFSYAAIKNEVVNSYLKEGILISEQKALNVTDKVIDAYCDGGCNDIRSAVHEGTQKSVSKDIYRGITTKALAGYLADEINNVGFHTNKENLVVDIEQYGGKWSNHTLKVAVMTCQFSDEKLLNTLARRVSEYFNPTSHSISFAFQEGTKTLKPFAMIKKTCIPLTEAEQKIVIDFFANMMKQEMTLAPDVNSDKFGTILIDTYLEAKNPEVHDLALLISDAPERISELVKKEPLPRMLAVCRELRESSSLEPLRKEVQKKMQKECREKDSYEMDK